MNAYYVIKYQRQGMALGLDFITPSAQIRRTGFEESKITMKVLKATIEDLAVHLRCPSSTSEDESAGVSRCLGRMGTNGDCTSAYQTAAREFENSSRGVWLIFTFEWRAQEDAVRVSDFCQRNSSEQITWGLFLLGSTILRLVFEILYSKQMGSTCQACKHEVKQEIIHTPLAEPLKQNIGQDTPRNEKASQLMSVKRSTKVNKSKKETSSANASEKSLRNPPLKDKENQDQNHIDIQEIIEKKAELATIVSQPLAPSRNVKEGGVRLEKMPDYLNSVTQQKLNKLPRFEYSRPEFEAPGAVTQGPIEFEQKYVYMGQWKEGKRCGRGKQIWRDGSCYEGYWSNNMASGFGRLIHSDGDSYEGEWKQDRAEGFGMYIHTCGATFKGSWKNDKQEGYGEQVWPDGAVYKGQYQNGKKHGKGKFQWADNSSYEGEFVDNNINGFGKYTWKDARVYEGTWVNNKMEGKGNFAWPDGRSYEGEYLADKKHGKGVFKWPDGRVYSGEWVNGKQHGRGQYKNKKGIPRNGVWENGTRIKWQGELGNQTITSSEA